MSFSTRLLGIFLLRQTGRFTGVRYPLIIKLLLFAVGFSQPATAINLAAIATPSVSVSVSQTATASTAANFATFSNSNVASQPATSDSRITFNDEAFSAVQAQNAQHSSASETGAIASIVSQMQSAQLVGTGFITTDAIVVSQAAPSTVDGAGFGQSFADSNAQSQQATAAGLGTLPGAGATSNAVSQDSQSIFNSFSETVATSNAQSQQATATGLGTLPGAGATSNAQSQPSTVANFATLQNEVVATNNAVSQDSQSIFNSFSETIATTAGQAQSANSAIAAENVIPVTNGMTLDATWTIGQDYTDIASVQEFSGKILATINPSDSGFIWESGGSVIGGGVYCYQGVLYFQLGDGSASRQDGVNMMEANWPIPAGENLVLIEFSGSGNFKEIALYIDGGLVDTATMTGGNITIIGTDPGTIGEDGGNARPRTRMQDGGQQPPFAFTGVLNSDLSLYINEITTDVAGNVTATASTQSAQSQQPVFSGVALTQIVSDTAAQSQQPVFSGVALTQIVSDTTAQSQPSTTNSDGIVNSVSTQSAQSQQPVFSGVALTQIVSDTAAQSQPSTAANFATLQNEVAATNNAVSQDSQSIFNSFSETIAATAGQAQPANSAIAAENVIPPENVIPVTNGMTVDAVWSPGGGYNSLNNVTEFSIRVAITLLNTSTGTIIESGGTGSGFIGYVFEGVIYFQIGSGASNRVLGSNAMEVSWVIPTGSNSILLEYSAKGQNVSDGTSKSALYIDGALVSESTMTNTGILSGSNTGGLGNSSSAAPNHRTTASPFSGTFDTDCDIYLNESTADVA